MAVRPRWLARLISLFAVAAVMAGALSVGQAAAFPTPVAAWPAGCDTKQKVAFLDFPEAAVGGQSSLESMEPSLRALAQIWPVKRLRFRLLTAPFDTSGPGVDAVVNELETRVDYLEAHGFNRIGLPAYSAFLAPFIHGTAGSLGGVPLETRHPNSVFVTINNGTSATEDPVEAGNVFRFYDIPSNNQLASPAIDDLITGSGEMLILYQDNDVASADVKANFETIAAGLGITVTSVAIDYNGSNFDSGDLTSAAAAIDALPAGSLVVHIVNGVPSIQDQYVTDALAAGGIFVDHSSNGPIRHFAGNYFPSLSVPVPVEFGYSTADRPSWQSTKAGFPTSYADWFNDGRQKLYMDAFGFLAKCGKFHGILDGFLKFDAGGTRINKQYERVYFPANSTTLTPGERFDNPRWYDDQYNWDWNAVFGE